MDENKVNKKWTRDSQWKSLMHCGQLAYSYTIVNVIRSDLVV